MWETSKTSGGDFAVIVKHLADFPIRLEHLPDSEAPQINGEKRLNKKISEKGQAFHGPLRQKLEFSTFQGKFSE